MINVAFVLTSLPVGGQERVVLDVVKGLDSSRFRSFVYCLKETGVLVDEVEAAGAKVVGRFYKKKWDLRVFPKLVARMRADEIDVVETVSDGDAMFWGRLAAKFAGVPVITSSLHTTKNRDGRKVVSGLNQLLTGITDRFIVLGKAQQDYLAQEEGLPDDKMVVIHNGVDVHRFDVSPERTAEVRRAIGAESDRPLVGIVAVLRPEKAHTVLLQAAQVVAERFPRAMFVIIGDGPERESIAAEIKERGLADTVLMLGLRRDVPDVLSALDIAVLCSDPRVETFSISILEYMSAGKPVVSTRVGSVEELVSEGETAILVPPREPHELADAIMRLIEDKDLACRMGDAGRQRVQDHFSVDRMVREREQLFTSLLEKQRMS